MANRGGRPALGPISDKGSNFATRISAAMRLALETEAVRTGRSKSQIGEIWLEEGRHLHGLGVAKPAVADALRTFVRFAQLVEEQVGDPGDLHTAREALISGWRWLAEFALPFTPKGADKVDLAEKLGGLTNRLAALNERIKDQIAANYDDPGVGRRIDNDFRSPSDVRPAVTPANDPVIAAFLAKTLPNTVHARRSGELISLDHLVGYALYRQDRITVATIDDLANGLATMKQSGQSFGAEIEACLQEIPRCRKALAAYEAASADARALGEKLAATIVEAT
jgi:hypothetical protein